MHQRTVTQSAKVPNARTSVTAAISHFIYHPQKLFESTASRIGILKRPINAKTNPHSHNFLHFPTLPYPPQLAVISRAPGQLTSHGLTYFIVCWIRHGICEQLKSRVSTVSEVYMACSLVWQLPLSVGLFDLLPAPAQIPSTSFRQPLRWKLQWELKSATTA